MRLEKFMDEGKYKLVFAGFHLKDSILDDITVEELQETVYSNIPNEKINENTVKKEFESLLKSKINDAKFVAKKVIPSLTQDLQDMVEGCDGSGKKKRKRKGKDNMDEGLIKQVHKAKKLKGKKLETVLTDMHSQAYEVLYNLDIALSDSFGKENGDGIKKARTIVQKALNELHTIKWIKAMDIMFKGKSDLS